MSSFFYIPPPYPFPDQWNQQGSIQTSGLWLTPCTHFFGVNPTSMNEILEKKEDCNTRTEKDLEGSTVCSGWTELILQLMISDEWIPFVVNAQKKIEASISVLLY